MAKQLNPSQVVIQSSLDALGNSAADEEEIAKSVTQLNRRLEKGSMKSGKHNVLGEHREAQIFILREGLGGLHVLGGRIIREAERMTEDGLKEKTPAEQHVVSSVLYV